MSPSQRFLLLTLFLRQSSSLDHIRALLSPQHGSWQESISILTVQIAEVFCLVETNTSLELHDLPAAHFKAVMTEFEQKLVEQLGNQQLFPMLPLEDAMDVDIGEDAEMLTTPPQGSTSTSGLLSPQIAANNTRSQQHRPNPFLWNTISAIPELTPVTAAAEITRRTGVSTVASTTLPDQEMSNATDYMMPLPDPYIQTHGLISPTDVGNATDALFTHMKARFNPDSAISVTSGNIQGIMECRTLPIPMPMSNGHQPTLSYHESEERRLPPPKFHTPGPGIISVRKQKTHSLSDILAAQEGKMQVRQLDGMSFHHVVQQPFANELRAHYAADEKSCPGGRKILMYKAQLPAETRRSAYDRQVRGGETEMWYFFEIKTSDTPALTERSVVLAIPAGDVEESKAEECPMFRGGGQINARRREYSVKPFGRFRLETINVEQELQVWTSIRHDFEDGSCRLFTWTEV